ncbi:MAG: T9SS type A sorting domain-containing protein, partial [Bacteroidota bacterium]
NCGAVNLTFTETISGDLCLDGYAWKRLWTATDECGNTAQVETVIWVNPDIEGPVFTYVPPTPDVDCDNIPDWELPIAEDACGEVTLTFTESISGDLCIDGYAWKRLWTATDECGNTAQVETVIWVNPDKEGPVFTFVPEGDLIGCDEFPPTFGEPEVEDACGNVTLTFFDQFIGNPNGCEEGENFDYERWWIATDECGNETTAKQTFWVKPDQTIMGTVSGQLLTESAEWIEAAEVSVEGNGSNWTNSLVTDEEGTYDFVLPLDHNYSIIPQRNDDLRNGVSTMDLILMSKHILGMELLDSPYKIIAADINNSGTVTAFDLVELSKVILHISDEFSNNQSWRFIDESYVFVDPTHPFGSTFPERHDINGLSGEVVADFIGVKVGDVNGSAQANSLQEGDTRNANKKLHFTLEDRQLQAGETYTIDFKASDFQSILGYQFTLQFSTADLGFIDWQGGVLPGLSMRNFGWGKLEEGYIMGNWYHEKAWSVEEDETLFQMTFQAINTVRLSEVISLNPQYTAVEAYDAFTERMDLGLKFTQLKEGEQAYPFQLLQNHPNPFKQSTQVRFLLPEASNVTFTVYDLAGQVLQEMTGDFVKGYNEITIDRSQISGSGVLYYRLETPSRSATKRMIMLHD